MRLVRGAKENTTDSNQNKQSRGEGQAEVTARSQTQPWGGELYVAAETTSFNQNGGSILLDMRRGTGRDLLFSLVVSEKALFQTSSRKKWHSEGVSVMDDWF